MKQGIVYRAYQLALTSESYPFKTAAVVFKGKRILSIGINEVRYNGSIPVRFKRFLESQHAEAAALAKCKHDELKGCSILICRVNAGSKKMSSAKPCGRCQAMLYDYGIKNVYCTNDNGKIDKYLIKQPQNDIKYHENGQHDYRNLFIIPVEL